MAELYFEHAQFWSSAPEILLFSAAVAAFYAQCVNDCVAAKSDANTISLISP
jgi:hypothetical protein